MSDAQKTVHPAGSGTPIPGVGLTQSQLDDLYVQLMATEQKAKALRERLVERRFDYLGGRLEDLNLTVAYAVSVIPLRARNEQMAELDRRDQVAT